MENNLYIGLSRQVVLQAQMDMVANNVANVNTPGYRGQSLLFTDFIADPKGQDAPYSMVYDYGQYVSTAPGSFQTTGNKLDVALQGPGFFQVNTPQGPRYTRAGNFTLGPGGEMMTPSGDPLGVNVPPGSRQLTIDERGAVSTEDGIVGQLTIVEFANTEALIREGNNLYRADGNAAPAGAANTRAMQGMLEGSNVQAVVETTRMINILRDYQSLQRLIQSEHDLERSAIQRLTQRG
jgi:flagellar basal-body rod protein FlgF